jgi:hypothetical protein
MHRLQLADQELVQVVVEVGTPAADVDIFQEAAALLHKNTTTNAAAANGAVAA